MRSARVFLAIGISPAVASAVAGVQKAVERGAPAGFFRFGDAGQAHVTLRFLGQRSSEEQGRIALAAATVASESAPFDLAFGALGVFPDERRPHTLWMGLRDGRQEVITLAARLTRALERAGFPPEARPFAPHLTLARIKRRPPPGLMTRVLGSDVEGTELQRVENFLLMESRAAASGVRYVPLRSFRMEDACTPSR
jgi:2'-5' RNA ligase